MKVEVQFLNNRNRPAGFTEFFLTNRDLDQVLAESRIRLPSNEGIGSYAEYWAILFLHGYRFLELQPQFEMHWQMRVFFG